MRPRPKTVQQILTEKWPDKQPQHNSTPEYNSQIEQELALYLPEKLKGIVKVKQFEKGMLTISIPNASFQMQFNAIRSQLMSRLRLQNPNMISIKCVVEPTRQVQVNTQTKTRATHLTHPIAAKLSSTARLNLTSILPDMPEEIRVALQKLMDNK